MNAAAYHNLQEQMLRAVNEMTVGQLRSARLAARKLYTGLASSTKLIVLSRREII